MLKIRSLRNSEIILILAFLTLLVYSNALSCGFLWDDYPFFVENPLIRQFRYLPDFFFKKLSDVTIVGRGFDEFYRPLFLTSFMIDYHFWKLDPFFSHLVNVTIHIFNVILIFILIIKLTQNRLLSFFTALFFGLHPIHTDAVTPVFNRMDVLVSFFIFLSFNMFIDAVRKQKFNMFYYICSAIFFILGLLSKEFAFVLPAVFVTYDFLYECGCNVKNLLKRKFFYINCILIEAIYFIIRFFVLKKHFIGISYERGVSFSSFYPPEYSFWKLPVVLQTVMLHLKNLILPIRQQVTYLFRIKPIWDIEIILSFIVILLMLIAIIILRSKQREISFFLAWFFIMLLPVSNIFSIGNHIFEHYVYLSSLSFCFFLAFMFSFFWQADIKSIHISNNKKIVALSVTLVSLFYSYKTLIRNYDWKHEFVLWSKEVKNSPYHPLPHINLGVSYLSQGLYEKALQEYHTVISLYPDDPNAWHAAGVVLMRMNKFSESIEYMQRATEIDSNNPVIFDNIGKTYNIMGKFDLSIENHKKAIELNPRFFPAYYNLGIALFNDNKLDPALDQFNKVLMFDPNYAEAYYGIGLILEKKGNYDEAVISFKKVLEADPHYQRAIDKLIELTKKHT